MVTLLRGREASFDAIFGFDHLVADLDQFVTDQLAYAGIVLDKENGLRTMA